MSILRRPIAKSLVLIVALGAASAPAASGPWLLAPWAVGHVIGAAARLATLPLVLASAAASVPYGPGYYPRPDNSLAPYYSTAPTYYARPPYYASAPAYYPRTPYYAGGPAYYPRAPYGGAPYYGAASYRGGSSYNGGSSYYRSSYTNGYRGGRYTSYSGYRGPSGPGRSMYYRR